MGNFTLQDPFWDYNNAEAMPLPTRGDVEYVPYKGEGRSRLRVDAFVVWAAAYGRRFGCCGYDGGGRVKLHRRFGYMADRSLAAAQARMGGAVPDHPARCRCRDCVEWATVLASEDDNESSLGGRGLPPAEQFGKGDGERV